MLISSTVTVTNKNRQKSVSKRTVTATGAGAAAHAYGSFLVSKGLAPEGAIFIDVSGTGRSATVTAAHGGRFYRAEFSA